MEANEKTQRQIINLTATKQAYGSYILCGCDDPYPHLMKEKLPIIVGPKGSNLFCIVRIKNSGKAAMQYRQFANKLLFENKNLQEQILENFSEKYPVIEFSKRKNPVFIDSSGQSHKTAWHHSPNHILTISLILEKAHQQFKHALHYEGKKGGNAMFTVKN